MEKAKFIKKLVEELKRLEEVEHVSDFANAGLYEEVDAIISEINYYILEDYMERDDDEYFEKLRADDIPKQYVLTFTIYLFGSGYKETDILIDWDKFSAYLYASGRVGKVIS